jgi:hypothetical protein
MTNSAQALTSVAMISAYCTTPVSLLNKPDPSKQAYFNSSIIF